MNLTAKQKDELHRAMLGYLKQTGCEKAVSAFEKEAKLTYADDMKDKMERKWRSILRLETKCDELDVEIRALKENMDDYGREGVVNDTEALPELGSDKHKLEIHQGPITKLAFHPKFNLLCTASEDNTIVIWDAESGSYERTLKEHTDIVYGMAFNPSGTILATCSADTRVLLWDFNPESETKYKVVKSLLGHDHTVSACCWSGNGELLFTASRDKSIKMWEVSTGHVKKSYEGGDDGHTDWVRDIKLSPDESQMVSCGFDQTVKVWDLSTGNVLTTLRDHDHDVLAVAFSNAKADQFIMNGGVLDEDDTKATKAYYKSRVESGKGDKGGMFVVSCSRDRTIRLWFPFDGVCVKTLRGHENWVRDVAFHPSGRYIISCADDASIRVWDLNKAGRQAVRMESAHESFVQCLAWNRHTPMMASGGVKNEVKIWECSAR